MIQSSSQLNQSQVSVPETMPATQLKLEQTFGAIELNFKRFTLIRIASVDRHKFPFPSTSSWLICRRLCYHPDSWNFAEGVSLLCIYPRICSTTIAQEEECLVWHESSIQLSFSLVPSQGMCSGWWKVTIFTRIHEQRSTLNTLSQPFTGSSSSGVLLVHLEIV